MSRYQLLAAVTAVCTYGLIVMGGVVRVTGSGLGCPDWPTCHGGLIPPLEPAALIEWSHRLLGAIVSPLILATTIGAWLWRRHERRVLIPATLAPALLAIQIPLGGLVVYLELPSLVVLVHLLFALLIFGLLVWVAVAAGAPRQWSAEAVAASRRLRGLSWAMVIAVFLLLIVGGLTRATGAGFACQGFPDCNGQALPFGRGGGLVDLHLTHRLLAYGVALLAIVLAAQSWRWRRALPAPAAAATILIVVILAQIVVGALGVTSGLTPLVRGLHLAGAAAVWAFAVLTLALAARAGQAAPLRADAAARERGAEIAQGASLPGY